MSNVFDGMGTDVGSELGWDEEIEKESGFILLTEGDYDFEIESFERGRFNGSEKMSACNMAKLKVKVVTPEGETLINHNLFLNSKCEGILSAFFISIGQKKHGEKIRMNWNQVIGAKGRAKIGIRNYDGKQYNEVKRFLEPAAATQPKSNYKPGSF